MVKRLAQGCGVLVVSLVAGWIQITLIARGWAACSNGQADYGQVEPGYAFGLTFLYLPVFLIVNTVVLGVIATVALRRLRPYPDGTERWDVNREAVVTTALIVGFGALVVLTGIEVAWLGQPLNDPAACPPG